MEKTLIYILWTVPPQLSGDEGFHLAGKKVAAIGRISGNGFTVCKGSGFCPAETKSCHKHIKTMRMRGNTVGDKDGFSGGRCKSMLIPLPPLDEQIRIVEKIDEIFANMK